MAEEKRLVHESGKSEDKDLAARVQQLESALKSAQAALPLSLVPEHGAGEGMDVAQTWSLAEQEAAKSA